MAHGGGRRCMFETCTKSAKGRSEFCIRHGGGRRCMHDPVDGAPPCEKSAEGSTMYCKRHGGGKRCRHESGCETTTK
jgi:hypothetical protein